MAKLFVRAGFCLRAGLCMAVTALASCPFLGAQTQSAGLFALLGSGASHKKPAPAQPPPVRATLPPALTIPVEALGFSPPGALYLGARNTLVSLDFLDEDRLLFTFRVPGLIHRDHGAADPNSEDPSEERQIRAVVLRLPQGEVQAEALWTLHDRRRYLWMLDNGQFLLRDQDTIQLGDASLQLKPFLHFPGPVLWVELDPARKYMVTGSSEPPASASRAGDVPSPATATASLVSDEDKPASAPDMVLRILRRESGKVMLVSHIRSAVHLAINTDGYLETLRGNGRTWVVNLNHFTGGSSILGNVESVCSPLLDFVSLREFLATTCGSEGQPGLQAMTTGGRRLWESQPSSSAVWPLLVMGPDGSRIARETLTSSRPITAWAPLDSDDIKGQDVQVLDATTGKMVLRAQASPMFDGGGNVAISPSGRRVAILMAEGIQVFDLPAPAPLPDDPQKTGKR